MDGGNSRPGGERIVLHGAGVRRGGRWIVRHVDLAVRNGEIVTLIGPNGSGKTTTARLAIGLIRADEGEAWMAPGTRVGYVPQRLAVDPAMPLTVARLMRLTRDYRPATVAAALAKVSLPDVADRQVCDLSGGELQRVLLARAIMAEPDLLVLDEPMQGVDFAGIEALYRLISQVREETGCAVLLISHDLHLVMARTDSVVCLNGHVCCTGSPQAVSTDPEYVRLFGPAGDSPLAYYRHRHDHVHLPDGRISRQGHDGHGAGEGSP